MMSSGPREKFLIISSHSKSLVNFRLDLILAIRALGIDVITITGLDDEFDATEKQLASYGILVHGIPLKNTSMNLFKDFSFAYTLYTLIRKIQPQHVLCYTIKPVLYGPLLAKIAGVPHVYTLMSGMGYIFMHNHAHHKIMRFFISLWLRLVFKISEKVFFQNRDDLDLFSLESKAILLAGSGVNLESFAFTAQPETLSFIFIGRIVADKGIREYLAAARLLKKRYPHISFKVLGGFHSNPTALQPSELQPWIDDGTIEYLGRVDDVRPYLAASSVCVLPSYREGMPRSVLEAMAMGRPIITTLTPGCKDTVIDGQNGFLVPARSTPPLANAMESFIKEPQTCITMGQKSRNLAENVFDVKKVNTAMLAALGLKENKL